MTIANEKFQEFIDEILWTGVTYRRTSPLLYYDTRLGGSGPILEGTKNFVS